MMEASHVNEGLTDNSDRTVFVRFQEYNLRERRLLPSECIYRFRVSYRRWVFDILLLYHELIKLEKQLMHRFPNEMNHVSRLERHPRTFHHHHHHHQQHQEFIQQRVEEMTRFLQQTFDQIPECLSQPVIYRFLHCSVNSFLPELGRKWKEGYLKKSSGGYIEKFSSKFGDYITVWKKRWVVLYDNCIVWYKSPDTNDARGLLQISNKFTCTQSRRTITMETETRKISFVATNRRIASEWVTACQQFYSFRVQVHQFKAAFPPRLNNDVRVYIDGRDYFHALVIGLLQAQSEILITSWKNNPSLLLTRPPLPPITLQQLLRYKAQQGVKVYVLLYKEISLVGHGNDSMNVKQELEAMSDNIHVIRHPNKLMGGSKALLWSHHEKIVVIDRNIAFVGGIDLSFQRWDNPQHRIVDEDELCFPGDDYVQPATAVFQPVVTESISKGEAEENQHIKSYDIEDEVKEDDHGDTGENMLKQSMSVSHLISDKGLPLDIANTIFHENHEKIANNKKINNHKGTLLSTAPRFTAKICCSTSEVNVVIDPLKSQKSTQPPETRDSYPRMTWHDVQSAISGRAARDVASHFVQRWNHHRLSTNDQNQPILLEATDDITFTACARCGRSEIFETLQFCPNCNYDLGRVSSFSASSSEGYYPESMDHFSFIEFEYEISRRSAALPFCCQGDCPAVITSVLLPETTVHRSGVISKLFGPLVNKIQSQDIFPMVGDVIAEVNGITVSHLNAHQIERLIERAKRGLMVSASINKGTKPEPDLELEPESDIAPLTLTFRRHYVEKSNPNIPSRKKVDREAEEICEATAETERLFNISTFFHNNLTGIDSVSRLCDDRGTCSVQVLRSVGPWSIGTKTETSIMACYLDTIRNAEHFIYIENQYFLSNLAGDDVSNPIAEALLERILRAHREGKAFRVIIMMSLHPEGDFTSAMEVTIVMHYEFLTINRGERSLFGQLRAKAPDIVVRDYIEIFSLRNWGILQQHKIVSDQIYIHGKVLIADDRIMVIGSANINDRSMLGDRDSEVAVRIEDNRHIETFVDCQRVEVGQLPHNTRLKLMRHHVCDLNADFSDLLNPDVYGRWREIAAHNSDCYDRLDGPLSYYRCVSSANYSSALKQWRHNSYFDQEARSCLQEVQGFLVYWPENFLKEDELAPSLATRSVVPDAVWL